MYSRKICFVDNALRLGDKTVLARKTIACYRLAKDLDTRDEYTDEQNALKQRPAKKIIGISPKEETNNGLSEPTGSEERYSHG